MPEDNSPSIADRSWWQQRLPAAASTFAVAFGVATIAAIYYATLDLTLSHYDARGHLVVARRVFDSLTPGWRQIGAVWLPLPHLLDLPAVATQWGYRTGYPAVAISIAAMAAGLAALSSFLYRTTGSRAAALLAPTLVLTNPNVLYLTSTPMTEPLLFGLTFLSIAALERCLKSAARRDERLAGISLAALTLTRYEGWLVTAALVAIALFLARRGSKREVGRLAVYPATAAGMFFVLGWATTGSWFVMSGFFEPDSRTAGDLAAAFSLVQKGLFELGGRTLIFSAAVGLVILVARQLRSASPLALVAAPAAAGMLPLYAFFEGHPHRIRYMVPLVAAAAMLASVALTAAPKRLRAVVALLVVAFIWSERPPWDRTAPMIVEAQWETPFRRGREAVTAYLVRTHDGSPILASMGSLGHYMQETSRAGFELRHFLHEGNGDLWTAAVESPARYVRWVLVEERAEGGDLLFARATNDPNYLRSFERVVEGGGMALYMIPDKR